MKIAVYKDNLSTGRGADRAVRNFAAGLSERGHDVSLMERQDFMRFISAGGGADAVDVIVATGSNEIVDLDMAGYFGRKNRARVVLQLHLAPRGFFKWRHPFRNMLIHRAFDRADAVQVLCRSYVDEFRRLAPHPKVMVIGNYTEMPPPQGLDDAESRTTILYPAAALNSIKNQKLLIESFATLAAGHSGWKVRLLGKDSTPYARMCRKLIAARRLAGRVEIVGFTDDLAGEYSRAAFVAFPSNLEGFPLAVLEAAQFALPVVAHRALPGIEDIVTESTGLVTDPTVPAFAAALGRMMEDAALRRRLGEAARQSCNDRYSREKIIGQWESLLESMV